MLQSDGAVQLAAGAAAPFHHLLSPHYHPETEETEVSVALVPARLQSAGSHKYSTTVTLSAALMVTRGFWDLGPCNLVRSFQTIRRHKRDDCNFHILRVYFITA
jgi:hypothetical protein